MINCWIDTEKRCDMGIVVCSCGRRHLEIDRNSSHTHTCSLFLFLFFLSLASTAHTIYCLVLFSYSSNLMTTHQFRSSLAHRLSSAQLHSPFHSAATGDLERGMGRSPDCCARNSAHQIAPSWATVRVAGVIGVCDDDGSQSWLFSETKKRCWWKAART